MSHNSASACPSAEQLKALLDGALATAEQEGTQSHVDGCAECQKVLESLTAGGESWVGVANGLKQPADPGTEKLAETLARIKANDPDVGRVHEDDQLHRSPLEAACEFLTPTDQPGLIGKLGSYEISEVIGQGGMGVVLKAFDPSLHRVVAVKVLATHLAHHAVARKRFIREAQAAAAVCHEHVVTIHAIEETGPQPKIVMQFVSGGSLQERIDQEGPLDLREILRIGMQTASGLAAAHTQGLVHRDVKPANILLENGVQRVKLTDFGLARVVDDASLTLSGVIAGTPQYMAPEQAWGRLVDHRADLFGLGAVMYAMCVGHSPFRARSTMAVLKRVCEEEPRPITAINPDIPEWFCRIILKLLAKRPEARFQTASEVSELLAQCLAHVQQPHIVPLPAEWANLATPATPAPEPQRPQKSPQPESSTVTPSAAHVELPKAATVAARSTLPPAVRIPFKLGIIPVLLTALSLFIGSSLFDWPMGPPSSYFGFTASMMAASVIGWFCFYLAWTSNILWLRLACCGFLLVAELWMTAVLCEAHVPIIVRMTIGLLFAYGLIYGTLIVLVRPWFTGTWQRFLGLPTAPAPTPQAVATSPWYRLARMLIVIVIAVPLIFSVVLAVTWSAYRATAVQSPESLSRSAVLIVDPNSPEKEASVQIRPADPPRANVPAGIEKLRGRWVVLTLQGPDFQVDLPTLPGMSAPPAAAKHGVPGLASMMGGPGSPPGAYSPLSIPGPTTPGATQTQWIEFKDHEAKLVGFSEVTLRLEVINGNELHLNDGTSYVLNGIFLQDADRLVICWGPGSLPVPKELRADETHQLVVCRREWTESVETVAPVFGEEGSLPAADSTAQKGQSEPPHADIPFMPSEATAYQSAWAKFLGVPVEHTNTIGMKLRLVPPGNRPPTARLASTMDSAGGGTPFATEAGNPALQESGECAVEGPLWVGAHEVTRRQFKQFVEDSKYVTDAERLNAELDPKNPTWRQPGIVQMTDDHPVTRVSITDAIAFTHWLSHRENKPYRLLTPAEWAFATRAGSMAFQSLGSDKLKYRSRFFDTTSPVGSYSRNPLGLYDLIGNVSEMTWHELTATSTLDGGSGGNYGTELQATSFPLRQTLSPKYCGGDFATTIEDSQPHKQSTSIGAMTGSPQGTLPAIGFRVAVALTSNSVIGTQCETSSHDIWRAGRVDTVTCSFQGAPPPPKDDSAPNDESPKPAMEQRVVVAIRDVVPQHLWPHALEWTDFEIERAELAPAAPFQSGKYQSPVWQLRDISKSRKLLDSSGLTADPVPPHFTNKVFTSPIPKTEDDLLAKYSSLPFIEQQPKATSQFGHPLLFRFFDTTPEPGKAYVYRYRLKYTVKGMDSVTKWTAWRTTQQFVEIPNVDAKSVPR